LQILKGLKMAYEESILTGNRVTKINIKSAPLDDSKTYKVLTSNFLADGGDGFLVFKQTLSYKNTGIQILDSMVKYLKKLDEYTPKIEGRVKNK